jgi:hypothetical protein
MHDVNEESQIKKDREIYIRCYEKCQVIFGLQAHGR